jgi:hypothetical protein
VVFVKCHIVVITIIRTGFRLDVSVDAYFNARSLSISLNFMINYWIIISCIDSECQVNYMLRFDSAMIQFRMAESNVRYGLELISICIKMKFIQRIVMQIHDIIVF